MRTSRSLQWTQRITFAARCQRIISITSERDAFCQSRGQSGRDQPTSEIVREALPLLERREQERDEAVLRLTASL